LVASSRWTRLLVFPRHTEVVEAPRNGLGDGIDRGVGAFASQIDRPSRQDVAEPVELGRHVEQSDHVPMAIGLVDIPLQRAPDLLSGTLDGPAVRSKCPLHPTHQLENPVCPHRLGLCVADQRRAQAPIPNTRSLREVDQMC